MGLRKYWIIEDNLLGSNMVDNGMVTLVLSIGFNLIGFNNEVYTSQSSMTLLVSKSPLISFLLKLKDAVW